MCRPYFFVLALKLNLADSKILHWTLDVLRRHRFDFASCQANVPSRWRAALAIWLLGPNPRFAVHSFVLKFHSSPTQRGLAVPHCGSGTARDFSGRMTTRSGPTVETLCALRTNDLLRYSREPGIRGAARSPDTSVGFPGAARNRPGGVACSPLPVNVRGRVAALGHSTLLRQQNVVVSRSASCGSSERARGLYPPAPLSGTTARGSQKACSTKLGANSAKTVRTAGHRQDSHLFGPGR